MKKIFAFILILLLLFSFSCKKSSTENVENMVELRVMVTENGQPLERVIVDIEAVEMVNFQWEEDETVQREWREGTYEDTQLTDSDGMARFILRNIFLANEDVCRIKKIALNRNQVEVLVDTTIYDIPKGGIKTLDFDL